MSKVTMPEPVAVVVSDYALFWAGSGPIAPLCERTGAKVGSQLITTDQAEAYAAAKVREAMKEAAQACEAHPDGLNMLGGAFVTCAQTIRALIPK